VTLLRALSCILSPAIVATGLSAQSTPNGTATVQAPGPHYHAGGLHELFLGSEYRNLWTTPISVQLLDLDTFAGGLRAVSKGGGQQTKSLLLVGENGREYFFRSVDKDPSATLPAELRGTVAGTVVRDQTSSAFPTAPLVVDRLLSAAGIPHGQSRLFVLPRHRRLGEFQDEFTGLMGILEDRIGGEADSAAHWRGAREIITSDTLFARVDRSANDRVDSRALLKARLFDLMIGDWDRHSDQWVWARFSDSQPRSWVPIPRDRDQAFVKYDGFLLGIARTRAPQLTNFGPDYPYIAGATWNGRDLDRRFLVDLEWPEWKAAASELQARLTDPAIEAAVKELPDSHYTLEGKSLAAALRTRRDRLQDAARRYYLLLAGQVDVRGTAGAEDARLQRLPAGELELTLTARDPAAGSTPYVRRRFTSNTKEVRLYLGPGDDRAIVTGAGSGGPLVRVLGEGGRDRLVDSVRGGNSRFYDDPEAPARTEGYGADVNRRPYRAPPRASENELPPRDWGSRWIPSTWASFGPDIGLFVGGGTTLTTYGFRKYPYASRHRFLAGFATGPLTYRAEYRGDFRRENSRTFFDILARASGIEVISFHGFGNEIPAPGDNEFYRVTQDALRLQPSIGLSLGPQTLIQAGPVLKYASTDRRPDRFLASLGDVYGAGNFGEIGGTLTISHDSRDRATAATRGVMLELQGSIFPALWDVDSLFGAVQGVARTYLSIPAPLQPTLALRAGGKKLWGTYPFFEAAFIGDASTVRLGRINRYAGDASAFGSAELRFAVTRFQLVLPTQLGVFGLADAGRVFLEGESSDQWHTAFGGGVSLSYLERAYTVSLAVASGDERTALYLQGGFGF
jgi:hypothetical protein